MAPRLCAGGHVSAWDSIGLICPVSTPKSQLDPRHFPASRPCYFKACRSFDTAYGMAVKLEAKDFDLH